MFARDKSKRVAFVGNYKIFKRTWIIFIFLNLLQRSDVRLLRKLNYTSYTRKKKEKKKNKKRKTEEQKRRMKRKMVIFKVHE